MTATFRISRRRRVLFWVALVVSFVLNGVQGRRILQLEARQSTALVEGTLVPRMTVRDLDGRRHLIEYGSNSVPTVLYVFSPTCQWCRSNASKIESLAGQIAGRYRVIGVSLSDDLLRQYITEYAPKYSVYSTGRDEEAGDYHFGVTPQTIVVSPDGKVLRSWYGAYQGYTKNEIERFFSVQLPS